MENLATPTGGFKSLWAFRQLKEKFGDDHAAILVDTFSSIVEHNLATKTDILEIKRDIEQLRSDTKKEFGEVRRDIEQLRSDTKKEFGEVRRDIEQLRSDTKKDIEQLRSDTKKDIEQLRSDTKKDLKEMESRLETKITASEVKIIKWVAGMLVAQGGLITALLKLL